MGREFSIEADDTLWVFLSDSNEVRHTYDVIHAVTVLLSRGVPIASMLFFTDDPQAVKYTSAAGCPNPLPISSLNQVLESTDGFSTVFLVVGGHGCYKGIGDPVKFAPHQLVAAARSVPGLDLVVIAVTQCFAGVFNFADARTDPPLVILGAANLGSSLSTPTNFVLKSGGFEIDGWSANSFMFYLFRWLHSAFDVDGDGSLSLLDAYKFAGAIAADAISMTKPRYFVRSKLLADQHQTAHAQFEAMDAAAKAGGPFDPGLELSVRALETSLTQAVSILHLNQEPWLLHADLARRVKIKI